jgi:hypothetical protein
MRFTDSLSLYEKLFLCAGTARAENFPAGGVKVMSKAVVWI